jgi:hypothetical protein
VEAEQGKKPRAKPKKRKQPEMQPGWLPRVDHAGKKGPRTRSMGLQIDYLDDHRTNPAKERRRRIWAEESRREEEEFKEYPDYMHMSRPAGPTEAEQEADWSFESATSGPMPAGLAARQRARGSVSRFLHGRGRPAGGHSGRTRGLYNAFRINQQREGGEAAS